MKSGFFRSIAWNNIKKNYRFYIPHILTGTGLLAVFYIVLTLASDSRLQDIRGGDYLAVFMNIGTVIIGLLSLILILYTNSFLMRQRKREYGLYNVLGMEKRHIGKVLLWEAIISGGFSLILGTSLGILFYKLCSLLICAILQTDIVLGFYFITPKTVIPSIIFFALLQLLSCGVNLISLAALKPVELLSSKQTGEREPRVKWLILIIGILTLGGGYTIAVAVKTPLNALILFFVAVFMVIIGTYCLFTVGSIFVLKLIKRNKKYYYRPNRFTSVSGLLFRMKQNAVGLASICILSTGVLVMISSTVSLYSGMQTTLDNNFPQDMYVSAGIFVSDVLEDPIPGDEMRKIVESAAEQSGVNIQSVEMQKYLSVSYILRDNTLIGKSEIEDFSFSNLTNVIFITNDTYELLTGKRLDITGNQIYAVRITTSIGNLISGTGNSLKIHGTEYKIAGMLSSFPIESTMNTAVAGYGVVVSDDSVLERIYNDQCDVYGEDASSYTNRAAITFENREDAEKSDIYDTLSDGIQDYVSARGGSIHGFSYRISSYWETKESVVGMYGAFLFLGIILGAVCLFATVLIIYYKQISEGYEDRDRYQIMKKVGMSDPEIKKTIGTQTLLVFFLPLVTAGIHVAFAFPIIEKLLHLLLLTNTGIFVKCTLITYAVFALVYVLIYSATSKTYYKIVH